MGFWLLCVTVTQRLPDAWYISSKDTRLNSIKMKNKLSDVSKESKKRAFLACLCFCAPYECLIKKLSSLKNANRVWRTVERFYVFLQNRFQCFCPFRILLKVNIKGEWMNVFPKQEKKINTWWRRKKRWKKERKKTFSNILPRFFPSSTERKRQAKESRSRPFKKKFFALSCKRLIWLWLWNHKILSNIRKKIFEKRLHLKEDFFRIKVKFGPKNKVSRCFFFQIKSNLIFN